MKHIAAKGIDSAYSTSKGIVLFDEDVTIQSNTNRDNLAHEREPTK